MKPTVHYLLFVAFLMSATTVRSEDQHCMNKALKEISVEIGGDNPQRVMTFVRDDPGYYRNMQCKWILKAANYDQPRQMYINVPVVDFDTNNATEAQCKDSNVFLSHYSSSHYIFRGVDIFNVLMKLNESSFRNDKWCKNAAVKVRTEIVNLWDSSYNVTAVFLSDNQQVRNDAKGIQFDVQVLGRDYCHRNMLYLDGVCYLITPESVTLTEAFKLAKNYLGNVFTGPRDEDMTAFLARFSKKNVDRQNEFPFESPLNLVGVKMWTGFFALTGYFPFACASYLEPSRKCKAIARHFDFALKANSSEAPCGIAVQWQRDGKPLLTCEPINRRLPALIQFNQIPANANDTTPWMFSSCSELPDIVKSVG